MPRYQRRPFFEKIGKQELIVQLTGKPWHSWWIWCRSNQVDPYSPDALKLWLRKNLWKVIPSSGDPSGGARRARRRDS